MGELIACHDCDQLVRMRPLQPGEREVCPRCGSTVYSRKPDALDRTLAFTICGLVLFTVANLLPFLTFVFKGVAEESLLSTGALRLYDQGYRIVGVLVFAFAIAFPLVKLLGLLYVLLPLRLGRVPPRVGLALRLVVGLTPWAMLEVFLLGVLVAMIKLMAMAEVTLGLAMYAFVGLMLAMVAADATLDTHDIWQRVEAAGG
jgi:paraquat-inducible protein A